MAKGRPREFDAEKALDAALEVFWRKGYEGASLPDLTEAMGINRPSLYAAFGNKEALFRKVIARYVEGPAAFVRRRYRHGFVLDGDFPHYMIMEPVPSREAIR